MKCCAFLILCFLSGCSVFTSSSTKTDLTSGVPVWFSYDSSRRGAIVVPDGQGVKYCAEPSPDTAVSLLAQTKLSMSKEQLAKLNADINYSLSVVDLTKRTQMINFLRESLYRLCEQALSGNYNKEDVKDSYNKVVQLAVDIVNLENNKVLLAREALKNSSTNTDIKVLLIP